MGPAGHFQISLIGFLTYSGLDAWIDPERLKCPSDWLRIGNNCYGTVGGYMSWAQAEEYCQINGHLASIHSYDEMYLIADYLTRKYNINGHVWIGLNTTDVGRNRRWRWSDGSPVNYLPWKMLEPSGFSDSQCVELSRNDLMHWNDNKCARKNFYVCQLAAFPY